MARKEKNEEARRAILREWDSWSKTGQVGTLQGMAFFNHLQENQPHLLDFKSGTVDKWQTVHGWLLRAGKVKD